MVGWMVFPKSGGKMVGDEMWVGQCKIAPSKTIQCFVQKCLEFLQLPFLTISIRGSVKTASVCDPVYSLP